jgi:hypothetical protein
MPAEVDVGPTARGRRYWWRPLLVFVVAAFGLGLLAGQRLWQPSRDNHFVRLAQGWTQGRLALEGKPPGFCGPQARARRECRGHTFDDYAVVFDLETIEGEKLRGYPCRTKACKEARQQTRVETWWILGRGWTDLPLREFRRRGETWYITFPPGPAVVLLPFVAIWGLGTLDVLLTVLLGAAIPAVLVAWLDAQRGVGDRRGAEHLWAAVAWTFAGPACFLAAHGRVWFTAQVVGALFVTAYVASAWGAKRPALAGVWLALAFACRPANAVFAVFFFAFEWWRDGRSPRKAIAFAGPILVVGALLMWHNEVRFSSPWEFGHRFLEIRWQARMQQIGMFSAHYLPRNLECLLWLMPQVGPFRVSVHGMALWVSSPWLLLAPWARDAFPQRTGLWVTAAAMAIPSLLYQNSGQLQFVYRFAVDWLPLVLIALVFGGIARRRLFAPLVVAAVALNVWGTWQFGAAPGQLFVRDPPGWPFSAELTENE